MDPMTEDKFISLTKEAQVAGRKSFVLVEDADGNWRGTTVKNGVAVFVREGDPSTALVALITHNGN